MSVRQKVYLPCLDSFDPNLISFYCSFHSEEENNYSSRTWPLAQILGLMSILCFLTYFYRKRSRRQFRICLHDRIESEDESILSHLSNVCVCNCVVDSKNKCYSQANVGEDTALLHDRKSLAYVT